MKKRVFIIAALIAAFAVHSKVCTSAQDKLNDKNSYSIAANSAFEFDAPVDVDADSFPEASNSDDSVLEVVDILNNGGKYTVKVKSKKTGSSSITVKTSRESKSVKITVTDKVKVSLDTQQYVTSAGNTYFFKASVSPVNMTAPAPYSSDASIAKTELYKGEGLGSYTYKVTTLAGGKASVGIELSGVYYSFGIEVKDIALLDIVPVLQNPELPAGCEVTALTALLNYHGCNVSKTYMADNMLEKDDSYTRVGQKEYRANPSKVFVGNPRKTYFGCYAKPIANAANKYLKSISSEKQAYDISGSSPNTLYYYVANNIPVLVWGTIGMSQPSYDKTWYDKDTGEPVQWVSGEHCFVLIGFDETRVVVSDPLYGVKVYSKSIFEKRYGELSKQAVVIK
jgi:uncharacterized protein YvpB